MRLINAARLTGVSMLLLLQSLAVQAQKKKVSMRDSLDRKFDMSDYIIEANGFVPIPIIITEPALGGFGGGLAPVFLKKKPPYIDTVNGEVKITPVAPDITGGVGLYTVNNTWFTGLFRMGTLVKSRIKYRLGIAYANVNISYFRTLPNETEKEFEVNIKTLPVIGSAIKRLGVSHWYSGLQYLFMYSKLASGNDEALPDFVKEIEKKSTIGLLSGIVEYDNRDNIFSPDNGTRFHVDGGYANTILGSDYEFWKINYYTNMYRQFGKKLVAGLRIDGQQVFGNPPFYFLPYIDMRGIPAERYQGRADILSELEFRYDFDYRWSVVLFGGTGKAFDDWSDFGSTNWVTSGGAGFRYLLARKFKLRVGIDLAKGPDTWAYYLVFGSNWKK